MAVFTIPHMVSYHLYCHFIALRSSTVSSYKRSLGAESDITAYVRFLVESSENALSGFG